MKSTTNESCHQRFLRLACLFMQITSENLENQNFEIFIYIFIYTEGLLREY